MTPQRPKSPSRIDVWRHEVSSYSPPLTVANTVKPVPARSFWRKLLGRSASKGSRNLGGESGKDGESVRTEMYSSTGSAEKAEPGEESPRRGASSMEIGEGSEGLGVGGKLRERAERLERARRLLEEGGGGRMGVGKLGSRNSGCA